MYRDIKPAVEDAWSKSVKRFSVAMMLICVSSVGFAGPWPKLVGGSTDQCKEAQRIANSAFNSFAPRLYAFPHLPSDLNSQLVLGTKENDISGGNALEANNAVFDKLPFDQRSVYWLKTAAHSQRLAIEETSRGWRGDTYSMFSFSETIHPDELLVQLQKRSDERAPTLKPVMDGWRPPLIFQSNGSGQIWFIDVGEPYFFLAPWQVHLVEPAGVALKCTVQFHPNAKTAVDLLPRPVQELERLLDLTIGPGNDEGTLQSTARLRLDVEHTWANAALRPWALDSPYNSRAEVDDGLKAWASNGANHAAIHRAIQRQYSIAERSLARYYQSTFRRSAKEARTLSTYVLDNAFRSHYVFHSESRGENTGAPNPWQNNQLSH